MADYAISVLILPAVNKYIVLFMCRFNLHFAALADVNRPVAAKKPGLNGAACLTKAVICRLPARQKIQHSAQQHK